VTINRDSNLRTSKDSNELYWFEVENSLKHRGSTIHRVQAAHFRNQSGGMAHSSMIQSDEERPDLEYYTFKKSADSNPFDVTHEVQ
jgi:hypothetical protein